MQALYCLDETGRLVLLPTARNRIKLATRELRGLTGLTLEDMAVRAGVSKSQWHNYENPQMPDLVPAHIFLPVELELGQAPVTRAFAAMNGLSVTAEAETARRTEAAELMGLAARESGEALATLIECLADGSVTPNEAKQIARDWADLRQVAEKVEIFAAGIVSGER